MPRYRLTYSDFEGVVEPTRALFSVTGVPCDEKKLSQEEWTKLKPSELVYYIAYVC